MYRPSRYRSHGGSAYRPHRWRRAAIDRIALGIKANGLIMTDRIGWNQRLLVHRKRIVVSKPTV